MNNTDIKEIIVNAIHAFPAMSTSATKALQLLSNPGADAVEVEQVIKIDPGLTANILKIANSAYFSGAGSIGSVRQAVVRLGWKLMSQVITASAMNAHMAGPVRGYDLPAGELWRHAVASTVATDVLTKKHHVQAPDELFTAALLHDVGKLVMAEFVVPFFEQIQLVVARGVAFDLAEREVLGTDHAEVGAMILERWNLPDDIVHTVRWHHHPGQAEQGSILIDLVHIADTACTLLGIGIGADSIHYEHSLSAVANVGLKGPHLHDLAQDILDGMAGFSFAFSNAPADTELTPAAVIEA